MRKYRISTSLWAKLYVWFRDEAIIRFCKATGGHRTDWVSDRCRSCRMTGERIEDHGSLKSALKAYAVVL
jgi:hypothetical protein